MLNTHTRNTSQVAADVQEQVVAAYTAAGVAVHSIGSVTSDASISIAVGGQPAINGKCGELRAIWEATSFQVCRKEHSFQEQERTFLRTFPERFFIYLSRNFAGNTLLV
jgi:hypothetical protein